MMRAYRAAVTEMPRLQRRTLASDGTWNSKWKLDREGKKRLLGLFSGLNWPEVKTVCSRTETKAFWQYIVLWQYILLWCNICDEERKRERDKDYHFNLKFFGSLTTIQPGDCCLHATSGAEWSCCVCTEQRLMEVCQTMTNPRRICLTVGSSGWVLFSVWLWPQPWST